MYTEPRGQGSKENENEVTSFCITCQFGIYTTANVLKKNSSVRCTAGIAADRVQGNPSQLVFGLHKNCHLPPTVVFRSAVHSGL